MKVLAEKAVAVKLDAKDKAILSSIVKNVRKPLSKIAKEVSLSRQSVEYRINQMKKQQLLVGSRTVVNTRKLGYQTYHVFLNTIQEQALVERATKAEFVNAIILYSGKYRFEISIMARSPDEFTKSYQKLVSGLNISESDSLLLYAPMKSMVLPGIVGEEKVVKEKNYSPDQTDIKLLKLLSNDATLSKTALAKTLKLSKDAISYRMNNLIASKYIIEFRPAINFSVMGNTIHAILFQLNDGSTNIHDFEVFLKGSDSILWAVKSFGYYDYLVYVITKDVSELHELINEIKKKYGDVINSYELLFAYSELKYQFMADSIS